MPGEHTFSHAYKESVYAVWYTQDRPSLKALVDLIEDDEAGQKPAPLTIGKWKRDLGWDIRAENADIELSNKTDREIVTIRMKMMKRHAEMAEKVADMAYTALKEHGFDSSTSAVTALFKAVEEEKRSRGMEVALTQVFSMNDTDLQKTMNRLLNRVSGISDEEVILTGEVADAVSNEETTDE